MPIHSTKRTTENSVGWGTVFGRKPNTAPVISSDRIDPKLVLRWAGIFCVLVVAFYLFNSGIAGTNNKSSSADAQVMLATASPTPTTIPPKTKLLFPYTLRRGPLPPIELLEAWMADKDGNPSEIFLLKEGAQYIVHILNNSNKSLTVGLRWIQSGPCGETILFDKPITLTPGEQKPMVEGVIPECPGIYSVRVEIVDLEQTLSASTLMVANPLSLVAIENHQGFDKCTVPTISQMQTWWVESPYWAVNMYIGGVSRACDQPNLTPYWMSAISQQGWTFIPTWVGPQAPCTGYKHRISSDKFTAYQEGKDEAAMAASSAVDLGLLGDMVIYYDLEGYSGDSACRNAVANFVRGWVERLHELGYQAGVYGSPCRSYIADWAEIDPVPDDVWIASWLTPAKYREDATVWLTGDAEDCLSNDLWVNHQRLRQYAGGHAETYGGLSFSIDSNATDGEVTVLPTPTPSPTAQATVSVDPDQLSMMASQEQVRLMQPLSAQAGWVLSGERLLITEDGGASWQDITPQNALLAHTLAVTFTSPQQGWIARQSVGVADQASLEVLTTKDGGQTWQDTSQLLLDASISSPIAAAYLNFIDERTGFLSVRLESSSAFSLGRLFATQNGGRTWEERSLPLGEPVVFVDAERGWIAGGPGGDQLFRTRDGGRTWQPQALALPVSSQSGQVMVSLPVFHDRIEGTLPVTLVGLDTRLLVYTTQDGGDTWGLAEQAELAEEPGLALPFGAGPSGAWWAAVPGKTRLLGNTGLDNEIAPLKVSGLPSGVIALDFVDDQAGWAMAQVGLCRGEKSQSASTQPFLCANQTYLLKTADGGQTWLEITP